MQHLKWNRFRQNKNEKLLLCSEGHLGATDLLIGVICIAVYHDARCLRLGKWRRHGEEIAKRFHQPAGAATRNTMVLSFKGGQARKKKQRRQEAEQAAAQAQERESKVWPRRESKTGKPEHPKKNHDGFVLQEKEARTEK